MIPTAIANGAGATQSELANAAITNRPVSARTTACPAVMFAYSRMVRANGLVNFDNSSTGVMIASMIGLIQPGTPCGMKKIVLAYPDGPSAFIPAISTMMKVMMASIAVTETFPVGDAPQGT